GRILDLFLDVGSHLLGLVDDRLSGVLGPVLLRIRHDCSPARGLMEPTPPFWRPVSFKDSGSRGGASGTVPADWYFSSRNIGASRSGRFLPWIFPGFARSAGCQSASGDVLCSGSRAGHFFAMRRAVPNGLSNNPVEPSWKRRCDDPCPSKRSSRLKVFVGPGRSSALKGRS